MLKKSPLTYTLEKYWENYQPFFPEAFRALSAESVPQEEVWAWKNYSVHLDRRDVPSSAYRVILLHGVGGYGRFLAPLLVRLSQLGMSAVAPDLPGYGLSRAHSKRHRKQLRYEDWVDCVSDLVDREVQNDGKPVILFGLSVGGMLAYHCAAKNSKVKGVIATCLLDFRDENLRKRVSRYPILGTLGFSLLQKCARITDSVFFPMGKISKMTQMSSSPAFNALVLKDSLGGANWIPGRFLRTLAQYTPEIEPEEFLTPLLLVHPAQDAWTPWELTEPFFQRIAGPKRVQFLEGCGHAPIEAPGIFQMERAILDFLNQQKVEPGINAKLTVSNKTPVEKLPLFQTV